MALIGNTNAQKIWNYLKSKEFNDCACAGIIANFDCESGLNPKNLQDSSQARLGFDDETYTKLVDSGVYTRTQFIYDRAGYGLAQITWHARKQAMYDFTKLRNTSIGELETQLEFFYKELSESFPTVLQALKSVTSVREASDIIMLKYECPADTGFAARERRASFAQKYYSQFVTNRTEGGISIGYKYYTKGQAVKVSDHFYSTEFDCKGVGCCNKTVVNEKLPILLEQIRAHFNAPVTITSPYRCEIHNSRSGGAVGSRHSKGDACDIVVKGVAPRKVAQYAESIGILGIGLYETPSDDYFVHIDTRDYKSFWYGKSEQPRTTFGKYTADNSSDANRQNTNNLDTILNIGDYGPAVKTLQEKLILLGYSCGDRRADGDFGNSTYMAVRKFQQEHGLGVDGIAGHQTLTAIDKAIESMGNDNTSGQLIGSRVRTTASLLNVRAGAGTTYRIIKQVKAGAIATVVDELNGWCKLDNPSGWVSKDYIVKI